MTDSGEHPDIDWPAEFEATPAAAREQYPHGFRVSRSQAFDGIVEELEKMGAVNVRVETAAPHTAKAPHRPYADRCPDDPSVVVYYDRDGQGFAVPCDRWNSLRDNAQAIAKYLDAKRALERYGVGTIGSEFETQALPPGPDEDAIAVGESAHEVLGVAADATDDEIRAAFRAQVKDTHPDHGGSEGEFRRLKDAKDALLG